jgi:uridine kinase
MSLIPEIQVVSIASPTCGGKTSLAAELQRRSPSTVATLSFDEYDLFATGSEAMNLELIEGNITNWEDPSLFDMGQFALDLAQIARGQNIKLQTRSRESIAAGEIEKTFSPRKTNVIEGLFVLHDNKARDLAEPRTFYIDIPLEVMVERRLATLRPGNEGNPWDDPEYIKGPMVEGTKKNVLPQKDLARFVINGLLTTDEQANFVTWVLDQQ